MTTGEMITGELITTEAPKKIKIKEGKVNADRIIKKQHPGVYKKMKFYCLKILKDIVPFSVVTFNKWATGKMLKPEKSNYCLNTLKVLVLEPVVTFKR